MPQRGRCISRSYYLHSHDYTYLSWIKWASIIDRPYETSRLMLEGVWSVWTQSAVWRCICITWMSNMYPWFKLISNPTVKLVWQSESKIYMCLLKSPTNHVLKHDVQSHCNGCKEHVNCFQQAAVESDSGNVSSIISCKSFRNMNFFQIWL